MIEDREVLEPILSAVLRWRTLTPAWVALRGPDGRLSPVAFWGVTALPPSLSDLPAVCDRLSLDALSQDVQVTVDCGCRERISGFPRARLRYHVTVPLQAEGEVVGVLHFMRSRPLSPTCQAVLFFVGRGAGVALRWARRCRTLQEVQDWYRNLFESLPLGVFRTTPDGTILDANSALMEMLGYPDLASLQAVRAVDLYVEPGDRRRWQSALEQFGRITGWETRWRRRDGSILWVRESSRRLVDREGRAVVYESVVEDVTERRRAEHLLRVERQVLEMIAVGRPLLEVLEATVRLIEDLAEGLLGSVLLLDEDGRRLRHGAAPSLPEAYNRLVDGLVIGPDVGTCGTAAFLKQVVVTPDIASDPRWAGYRDWALAYGLRACWSVPILSADDRVLGTFAMYYGEPRVPQAWEMELAERAARLVGIAIEAEQARNQVRQQTDRLRRLIGIIPEGVVYIDRDRRVVLTNALAESYLRQVAGVGPGGILTHLGGRPIESFLGRTDAPQWSELVVEVSPAGPDAVSGGVGASLDFQGGGPSKIFEVTVRSVAEAGEAEGWVLVLRDVTQERMNQLYVQTQERLAAVGRVVAGIVHDFNNLLTSILGLAELIRMRPGDVAAVRRNADAILTEGERATQMIRQILDFRPGRVAEPKPIDMAAFLREYEAFVRRLLPTGIDFQVQVEAGDAWVRADETQMHQMLTNLVVNARDAMPHGGRLTLRLARVEVPADGPPPLAGMTAGAWVVLEVADTGVGIPAEVLPRVFEPFFTTKPRGLGTGLGLSQVYGIVRRHGGHISVRSRPGQGTTFIIYLPAQGPSA